MTISTGNLICLAVTCAVLAALPIAIPVWWKCRHREQTRWRVLFFGALGFLISARVLELGVHMVCIVTDNPVSRFINGHTWAYVLYGCAMAGIFEECGRWVVLKRLSPRDRNRENTILYGLGHWGIEVLSITLLSVISALMTALTVRSMGLEAGMAALGATPETEAALLDYLRRSVSGFGAASAALTVGERVLCLFVHVPLTVVVWRGTQGGEKRYLLGAVLCHAGVDLFPALSQRSAVSMWLCELWLLAWAVGLTLWARRLYKNAPQGGSFQQDSTFPT